MGGDSKEVGSERTMTKRKTSTNSPAATPRPRPRTARPAPPAVRRARNARSSAAARRTIYVLSDSTGNLPVHMLTAFLTQFPPGTFAVHARPFLRTAEQVERALAGCDAAAGIVFHAVVAAKSKAAIERHCARLGMPACDLTGPFVAFLSRASGAEPVEDLRRLHEVDAAYERRVQALEFTLAHDDGLGLDTIGEADIVLAGVSRTSKTPTSIYLAQQGYKVANVSLAIAVDPPRELLAAPKGIVVGLTIDPQQLAAIRTRRNAEWQRGDTSYNDDGQVEEEVRWSRALFRRQGWPTLDVTNQAIEETAARIVALLGVARPDAPRG